MIARHWLAIAITIATVVVGSALSFASYVFRLYFERKAIERQIERHDRHIYAGIDDLEDCLICQILHAQFAKLNEKDRL